MVEAVGQDQACSKCGAEVRAGTAYCYSCGTRVAADGADPVSSAHTANRPHASTGSRPNLGQSSAATEAAAVETDANTQAALDELAKKLSEDKAADTAKDVKLTKAAGERKKARVAQKKSREFVWEPRNDIPVALLIAAVLVLAIAVFVVLVIVVWK